MLSRTGSESGDLGDSTDIPSDHPACILLTNPSVGLGAVSGAKLCGCRRVIPDAAQIIYFIIGIFCSFLLKGKSICLLVEGRFSHQEPEMGPVFFFVDGFDLDGDLCVKVGAIEAYQGLVKIH